MHGLDEPTCPECGLSDAAACGHRHVRRMVQSFAAALVLAGMGSLTMHVAQQLRHGPLAPIPTTALCLWLDVPGEPSLAALEELQRRALLGQIDQSAARVRKVASAIAQSDAQARARQLATQLLGRLPEPPRDVLMLSLGDSDATVRAASVEGLRRMHEHAHAAADMRRMATLATQDRSAEVRRAAVVAIAMTSERNPGIADALHIATYDLDASVRTHAAVGLGRQGRLSAGAIRSLSELSHDSSEDARAASMQALTMLASQQVEARGAILGLLRDRLPAIRGTAAWMLRGHGVNDSGIIMLLASLAMQDEDGEVRSSAMAALLTIRMLAGPAQSPIRAHSENPGKSLAAAS